MNKPKDPWLFLTGTTLILVFVFILLLVTIPETRAENNIQPIRLSSSTAFGSVWLLVENVSGDKIHDQVYFSETTSTFRTIIVDVGSSTYNMPVNYSVGLNTSTTDGVTTYSWPNNYTLGYYGRGEIILGNLTVSDRILTDIVTAETDATIGVCYNGSEQIIGDISGVPGC